MKDQLLAAQLIVIVYISIHFCCLLFSVYHVHTQNTNGKNQASLTREIFERRHLYGFIVILVLDSALSLGVIVGLFIEANEYPKNAYELRVIPIFMCIFTVLSRLLTSTYLFGAHQTEDSNGALYCIAQIFDFEPYVDLYLNPQY